MNVDSILSTFNECGADYILIGGMNFFLVHQPVVTMDVDLWIADNDGNYRAVHRALVSLGAEISFDAKGDAWRQLQADESPLWLRRQAVFCLFTPHGPLDIFRHVPGLEDGFEALRDQCPIRHTPSAIPFRSLSDELMIRCQLALPEPIRKIDRMRALGHIPGP
jgi:hypothetical protein